MVVHWLAAALVVHPSAVDVAATVAVAVAVAAASPA